MEILFQNSRDTHKKEKELDKFIDKKNYLEEIKTLEIIKTIDQISKYLVKQGKEKEFPDITIREKNEK